MGIIELAKRDIKDITTATNGFAVELKIQKASGVFEYADVRGTTAKHNMAFDTDGVMTSSVNVHVSIHEDELTEAGVTVRDAKHNVSLLQRLVFIADSTGTINQYSVVEQYPDQTIGLIVLMLVFDDGETEE